MTRMHGRDGRQRPDASSLTIGVVLLSNGAALVVHIVRGIPLPPLVLGFWAAGLLAILWAFVNAQAWMRARLRRTFVLGVVAGILATLAYDAAKTLLSQLDPGPWNPFEATRMFGVALLGESAPDAAVRAIGWLFHLSNGATFGMSFAFVFGRLAARNAIWAVILGAAWGVFLETFQLVLYPGWLGIGTGAMREFQQVSFLAHVVFGATLGLLVRRWRVGSVDLDAPGAEDHPPARTA